MFPKLLGDSSFDYVFYHFGDETVGFGGKAASINLSAYRGARVAGDIHIQAPHYLGTPIPTRKDEAGQKGHILVIDTNYVVEAPSFEQAQEKYKDINIGGVTLKKFLVESATKEESSGSAEHKSNARYLEDFIKEKSVEPSLQGVLRSAFGTAETI